MSGPNESFERAFLAVMEMWGRRYDTPTEGIPDVTEGEPFGCPVAVDIGQLAVAQSEMLMAASDLHPEMYKKYKAMEEAPRPGSVVALDEHRIRQEREFEDEQVAYLEVLWGRETFAYNAAIRDLLLMRRKQDNGTLRPPQTDEERSMLIRHVRALANDLARDFGLPDMAREEDDLQEPPSEG